MRVEAQAVVNDAGEHVSKKDGKTYRRAYLFIPGEDRGSLEASIPGDAEALYKKVKELTAKLCRATLNIRDYKGTLFIDLVHLELVNGVPPGVGSEKK